MSSFLFKNLFYFSCELWLIISLLICIVFGSFYDNFIYKKIFYIKLQSHFLYFLIITILFYILLVINFKNINNIYIFNQSYKIDFFINYIKLITAFSILLIALVNSNIINKKNNLQSIFTFELYIIFLLVLIGLNTLISCCDFISLYLSLELLSLSFYVLATSDKFSNYSTEAGLKYFILGSFSSGILLLGISYIYGLTGLINFYDLFIYLQYYNTNFITIENSMIILPILSLILIIITVMFKISVAPFHVWTPDIYEGSPLFITAFFSIVPKLTFLSLLFRIYNEFLYALIDFPIYNFSVISSLLSIILGTLGAIIQYKIKRFIAYSAIANIGYILLGFCLFNIEGFTASIYYLIIYMILLISIFSIFTLTFNKNNIFINLNNLILLRNSNFFLIIILSLFFFSMSGIPPLIGFFGKLTIFLALFNSNKIYILIFILVLSMFTTFYYIRVITLMFYRTTKSWILLTDINSISAYILSFTFIINTMYVLYPKLHYLIVHNVIISSFYYL